MLTMPRNEADSDEEPERGFDETLGALKQVVDKLESGQLSLEASLAAFEDGVRLARQGAKILDAAERRVEILTSSPPGDGRGDGAMAVVSPFSDGADPTGKRP